MLWIGLQSRLQSSLVEQGLGVVVRLIYFFFLQDGLMLSLCCTRGLRWWESTEQEDWGRNDPIWLVSRAGLS